MAKSDLTITISESDYQALEQALEKLSNVDKSNAVAQGLRQGMQIIATAGKANLQQRNNKKTGNLLSSIGVRVQKGKRRSYSGFRRPKGAHAHMINFGVAKRWTKKGYYRGSISKAAPYTGTKFWSDAVEQNKEAAVNTLMNAIIGEMMKIKGRN